MKTSFGLIACLLFLNASAAKARERTLSSEERTELDEYERVTAMLELMQSKARLSLNPAGLSP